MERSSKWLRLSVAMLMCGLFASQTDAKGKRYKGGEVSSGGTIVGVVRFEGSVPARETIKATTADKPCHAEPILREDLVVSDSGGVQWAVASIKGIKSGKPFPAEDPDNPAMLDQHGCRFVPHVLLIPKKRALTIRNSDGILHNVHTHAKKNRAFNKAQPPKVKELEASFKRPERIRVSCDVHDWMGAWVVVSGHPYHAVTGSDGTFRLENVPPGKHVVEIWHETLGKQTKEVTVSPNGETQVEFVLKK